MFTKDKLIKWQSSIVVLIAILIPSGFYELTLVFVTIGGLIGFYVGMYRNLNQLWKNPVYRLAAALYAFILVGFFFFR